MYADINMAFKPGSKKGLVTRQALETRSLQVTLRTHTAGCLLKVRPAHVYLKLSGSAANSTSRPVSYIVTVTQQYEPVCPRT